MSFKAKLAAVAFSMLAVAGGAVVASPAADAAIIPGRCTYTGDQPVLRQGSSGAAVRQAQCEYNWSVISPKIAEDGSFGPLTRAAIVRFQQCVGITADGIVGPVTWQRLNLWAGSPNWAC